MRRWIWGVVLLLLFFSGSTEAAPVMIRVAPQAEVSGDVVYLRDIAQIETADPQQADAFGALAVGRIPKPGNVIDISSQLLEIRVRASGIDCSEVRWDMPAVVSIHRQAQFLSAAEISRRAQQTVVEYLEAAGEKRKYSLEELALPEALALPAGTITYDVSLPGGVRPALVTTVQMTVLVDGNVYKKFVYRMRVHIYQDVLAAARPLRAGEKIAAADLKLLTKEVNAYADGCLTDSRDAVGFVLSRSVGEGSVLLKSMVEKPVIVAQGQNVNLVVRFSGGSVQMDGVALESGREGERIRVRNLRSRRILNGTVIDSKTVEISE